MLINFPVKQTVVDTSSATHKQPVAFEISQASESYQTKVKPSHAAEAIKSRSDINKVAKFLEDAGRYRDLLLFIMGINFGLRCGDLVQLRIGDVIDAKGNIVETFRLVEEKTKKIRTMAMNEAVSHALILYLNDEYNGLALDRTDYLFTSNSHRQKNEVPKPLTVRSVERLLKEIVNDECHIKVHASTHMLRKTFAYHFLMSAPERSRALELLCSQMNHSNVAYTLRYIGITQAEILDTLVNLDLGYLGTEEVINAERSASVECSVGSVGVKQA